MRKSMLHHLREARAAELEGEGAGEAGFTLIELMVVLLIIAILLAIAIPLFLGVTGGARDRSAQSNLTNALQEASAVYQAQGQTYPAAAGPYSAAAPEFTWNVAPGVSANQNTMSFAVSADNQTLGLAVRSNTGTCWYLVKAENASPGTFYGQKAGQANCTAVTSGVTGQDYSNANVLP